METNGALEPFRLAQPPVTRVRLTLYFEQIEQMSVAQMSSFIAGHAGTYPKLGERLPLIPWADEDPATLLINSQGGPAFPLVIMTNEAGDRDINFQSDRFGLAWEFSPDSDRYPGYEELRHRLQVSFDEFSTAVLATTGRDVRIKRAQAFYSNRVVELPGPALAIFLLTGQEEVRARALMGERSYLGARVEVPVEPARGITGELQAGVDSASDDESNLWLRVSADSEGQDGLALLDVAHEALLGHFIEFTPEWLREAWNQQ